MTREEAIERFNGIINAMSISIAQAKFYPSKAELDELCDMAIEALSEPKTIIGIDIPYGSDKGLAAVFKGNEKMVLEEVKEIMSVVRCKDCRYYNPKDKNKPYPCGYGLYMCNKDDYCSLGERREE